MVWHTVMAAAPVGSWVPVGGREERLVAPWGIAGPHWASPTDPTAAQRPREAIWTQVLGSLLLQFPNFLGMLVLLMESWNKAGRALGLMFPR